MLRGTYNYGYIYGVKWVQSVMNMYQGNFIHFASSQYSEREDDDKQGYVAGVISFVCGVSLERI